LDAIAWVESWYENEGLPSLFKIVDGPGLAPGLVEAISAAAYRPRTDTIMMVAPVGGLADPNVALSATTDDAFEAAFAAASPHPGDARERLDTLARVPPPRAFARLDLEDVPAAVGACGVEGAWAGLFAMRTDAAYRRRGLARRVLGSLLAWAAVAGAQRAWLQVEADNVSAINLYAAAGFGEAYRYRYWSRAGA
jgi:ribosomal protein S18 acetylase RimI-like enzyme